MEQDCSWEKSAVKYEELYNKILVDKHPNTKAEKININKADLENITILYGIDKAYAKKIIEYRDKKGKFTSKQELMNIKGIGTRKYKKLKNKITI